MDATERSAPLRRSGSQTDLSATGVRNQTGMPTAATEAVSGEDTTPTPIARPDSRVRRVDNPCDGAEMEEATGHNNGLDQEQGVNGQTRTREKTTRPVPDALSRVTSAPTTKPLPSPTMQESKPRPSTSSRSLSNLKLSKLRSNIRPSIDSQSVRSPTASIVPNIIVDEPRPSSRMSERMWSGLRVRRSEDRRTSIPAVPPLPRLEPFEGIKMDIPTGSFEDIGTQFEKKKESVANGGNNVNGDGAISSSNSLAAPAPPRKMSARRVRSSNSLAPRPESTASRVLSVDEDILSQKVRLMYDRGDENISDAELNRLIETGNDTLWEEGSSVGDDTTPQPLTPNNGSAIDLRTPSIAPSMMSSIIPREQHELAGGIEDWQNVQNEDVDRYGFIIPRRQSGEDAPRPMQRVATGLMVAAATPRRKLTLRREPSSAASIRSFSGRSVSRKSTDHNNRPLSSQSAYQPNLNRSTSRMRQAANRLPHNRDRRLVDEAAYMLTLPTTDNLATTDDNSPWAKAMKKKEWQREEKWRKMAKVSKPSDGSGMTFEFDVSSNKLVERTWKGIPDSWRATAWHAFLSASAKKTKGSPTDEELILRFNELQLDSSPDDVQIDIDVPRTISHHIMFRRRYRGGQRLLFRVLHAMSLYFPDTGYVQGMATLAATFLAYYDEEKAFVMLVRLWQLRGLDRLYRSGFSGLMEALDDFENEWLDGGEVAEKLVC